MDARMRAVATASDGGADAPFAGALVGREDELARVRDAIAADRWIVVAGEAGVGKTTLVGAAATAAHRRTFGFAGLGTLAERPYAALRRLIGAVDGDAAYVAAALERLVGPEVLLVDDLQWLDAASRAAVAQLVDRVAVVAAVRTGTAASEGALEFAAHAGCERLDLGPLGHEAAITLAKTVDPSLTTAQASRLATRAGGNPFFTVELATVGATSAGTDVVIRRRLAELGPGGIASARRLAVLGRPAVSREIGDGAAELLRAGIATMDGGMIVFQHQLFAEHVLASLGPAELASVRIEAARLSPDPLEAATLLLAAGRLADAAGAAATAERAATTAGDRIEALVVRAASATGTAAGAMKTAAAGELIGIHDYARATTLLNDVVPWDRASAVRMAALRGRIDLVVGNVAASQDRFDSVVAEARALMASGDPAGPELLVDVLRTSAQGHGWTGDPAGGLRLAEEAVAIARSAGTPSASAQTLLGYLLLTSGRALEAIGPLREAARALAASGDGPNELQALNVLLLTEMSISGTGDALATCRRLIARAEELHLYGNRDGYKPYLIFLLDAAGRYHEAIAVGEELAGVLTSRGAIYGPGYMALALTHVGRFDEARMVLARLEGRRSEDPEAERVFLDISGVLDFAEGRAALALRAFEAFAAMAQKSESDRLEPMLNAMWARWELGRQPGSPIDPGDTPLVAAIGPESQGLSLLGERQYLKAAEAFERGALTWDPFHVWNADRCRWAAGEALRLGGETSLATERLMAAEATALERDARPQLVRVQRSLRLLGVRRTAPRAAAGRDLLSGRERELLNLVSAGLSNAEIARRLGLGRPTIARMLSSAMAKLGVEHRTQLAARELV